MDNQAILSGKTIFLRSRAGSGKMIDIQNTAVRARWVAYGEWQEIMIRKHSGGIVSSGDVVFLRAMHTGVFLDVEGETVQARWNDEGTWQSLVVEKQHGVGPLYPNDIVCFKAHTGKHIDVEGEDVQARWNDCGFWQQMRIEVPAERRLHATLPKTGEKYDVLV